MAIARKPQTPAQVATTVDVDALIAKGGSIASAPGARESSASTPDEGKNTTSFTLRVPRNILETVDAHRTSQSYKVPRQQWILEAMMQRLEREMPKATRDE